MQRVGIVPLRNSRIERVAKMAAMALPIRELELSTDKTLAEAEYAVFYLEQRKAEPVRMTVKLGMAAFCLRFMLTGLAKNQKMLIHLLQERDFSRCKASEMSKLAESLDNIIERGWPVLERLGCFGPRAHMLFGDSLGQLGEQLNHLESIAMSLRSSADPETSLLMGLAVAEVAKSSQLIAAN